MIHLDTHVVVWLFLEQTDRLPEQVRQRIERDAVGLSAMVVLELGYLHEIGRLRRTPVDVMAAIGSALDLTVSRTPLVTIANYAVGLRWTRDPFDRLITANALVDGADLATADETIREHCPTAFWTSPPSASH